MNATDQRADRAAAEFLRRHGTMAAHATSYDDDTCEALIEAIPQNGSNPGQIWLLLGHRVGSTSLPAVRRRWSTASLRSGPYR